MDIINAILKTKDYNLLKREAKENSLAKAIMLISKDSLFSYNLAKLLAILILNDGEEIENEAYQRVILSSHPDVKVYPQKDKLLVADSEEIVLESYIRPIQAEKKIFIIKDFDISTESAQNKLLKILEEPPKNVYMILTCSNINQVLPTIRSRCNKYELSKFDQESLSKFLKDNPNNELVLALCDGYLGKAEKLAKMSNLRELFLNTLATLAELSSSKEVLKYSKKILEYKEHFNQIIEILSLVLEDMLAVKAKAECKLKEYQDVITKASDNYSIKAICQIQELLDQACKEQTYNVNTTLIIENLLLNILEVKFLCK